MAALNPRLMALPEDDRLELESWLVEFDQRWEEGFLTRHVDQIPPGRSWRLPALAEMVKIDLERQWQRGRQVSLESYLKDFPELGSPGDVSADLIQAEYEVRRQFGAPAALEDYLRRFPNQAAELAQLIARGDSALSRRPPSSPSAAKPAATPDELPEQFGRYRILKRLGQGGMGAVYLAEDTQLQRRVALKVASYGAQGGPEARQRLLAEARSAATLDHPYLCPVHDVGEIDGRLYLTMAYIDGQSLAESTHGKSLPQRQVAALVGKLALALQEAHSKGVIHRDLKPSNVMIKAAGGRREPVIVDFGLARREDLNEGRLTKTGQVMGTLDYMAPEQIRGELKEIGPPCDIYALGVILYELLTGQVPFEGTGLAVVGKILTQAPMPPSALRPDLDTRLEAICLTAMAKNVEDRFASMSALAASLTDFLRTPATNATPSTPAPAPSGAAPRPAGSDTLVARLLDRVAPEPAPVEGLPPALANHPDYTIQRELGRGGMGVVYLAHNKLMGRDEVLKVMGRQIMDRPDVLERFLREIRAVARLRHENIVTAYSATRIGDSIVFAMEYVEGLDLARLVQAKGPMPVAHACNFAYQAALGLQHAHEEGLIHRDIKPGNLMLARKAEKATVKVLDFGLAKATREEKVEGALTSAGQALGTPDYIAPEQITDAPSANIRADIYSLGATLYYLLTGRPPFQGNSLYDIYQAHISRLADPLNVLRPDVPAELAALVSKMMAKEPAQRFQTPGEVAKALTPFFKNAAFKSPKAAASQAGSTATGGGYAATQLETDADRLRGRAGKVGEESQWESTIDFREPESRADADVASTPQGRSEWFWPGVVAGVMLLGFLAAVLGGVFKVKTPDGVIVLENVPKDAEVFVDGNKVNLTWPGLGKPLEIRAVPGEHKVEVKKEGFKTFGETVRFKTDGSEEVRVRLEPVIAVGSEPKREDVSDRGVPTEPSASRAKDVVVTPAPVTEFRPLFNGSDLTGWKKHPSQDGNWYIEGGKLTGFGSQLSHLYTERDDFKDFHLRVRARINNHGSGGVCFRAQYNPDQHQGYPGGFGVQISSFLSPFTGSLWIMPGGFIGGGISESPVAAGQWFTLEVIAEGDQVIIKVDGKTTAQLDDGKQRFSRGHIALEQTHPEAKVEFSSIEIKELTGADRSRADERASTVITNSIGMKLVLIPAGEFLMGSPDSDTNALASEKPQHRVRISRSFFLGATEVTQGQYRDVMGKNPSHFQGSDDLPVDQVSWNDAIAFCDKLSEREKGELGGARYRLPTEAEWEYACRAGSTTDFFGEDAAKSDEFAWFNGNSERKTHPVGQKRPNGWGLYDVHGNVGEWCGDLFEMDAYRRSPDADPQGPWEGQGRVIRGGNWNCGPLFCRSAVRHWFGPTAWLMTQGFRVARRNYP